MEKFVTQQNIRSRDRKCWADLGLRYNLGDVFHFILPLPRRETNFKRSLADNKKAHEFTDS